MDQFLFAIMSSSFQVSVILAFSREMDGFDVFYVTVIGDFFAKDYNII